MTNKRRSIIAILHSDYGTAHAVMFMRRSKNISCHCREYTVTSQELTRLVSRVNRMLLEGKASCMVWSSGWSIYPHVSA